MKALLILFALVSLRLAAGSGAHATLARCRTELFESDAEVVMRSVCIDGGGLEVRQVVLPGLEFQPWTEESDAGFQRFDVDSAVRSSTPVATKDTSLAVPSELRRSFAPSPSR